MKSTLEEWIAPAYLQPAAIKRLRKKYHDAEPFPHLALAKFIKEPKLRQLEQAVRKQRFTRKEGDLFRMEQTMELAQSRDPAIRSFAAMMRSAEFTQWMSAITGVRLTGEIDMAGVIYRDTDYLLVHDDQVEGRKIAYILNLSRGFTRRSGGALALLDSDRKGRPRHVIRRILPGYGTFSFFTVSSRSHHQVEEVLEDKERLTVGGWLHG